MYEYQIDEKDILKALEEEKEKEKTQRELLEEAFGKIDKDFEEELYGKKDMSVYDPIELARKEETVIDEESMKESAENSLFDYKQKGEADIANQTEKEAEALRKYQDSSEVAAQELKESIEAGYAARKQSAEEEAVKRGLARSSIIINQIEAFDARKLDDYTKIDKELTDRILNINYQLDMLEVQKESALANFDLAYVVKLSEKINGLKTELQKTNDKVKEYNNEIAKTEAEYNLKAAAARQKEEESRAERKLEVEKFMEEYGAHVVEQTKYLDKYNLAKQYFASLSKEESQAELAANSGFYREHLKDYYSVLAADINKK